MPCDLSLKPLSPRYLIEGIGASFDRPMAYATYPRLGLNGAFGDEEVKGSAWFDHQWGSASWFLSQPSGGNVFGWDWVGINGDDGSDWIILIFRDMESRKILNKIAILFKDHAAPGFSRNSPHGRYASGRAKKPISGSRSGGALRSPKSLQRSPSMQLPMTRRSRSSDSCGQSGKERLLHREPWETIHLPVRHDLNSTGMGTSSISTSTCRFHVNRIDECIRSFFHGNHDHDPVPSVRGISLVAARGRCVQ